MKQARGIGVNDFLNKPVRKKALETILNTENLI
jgi:YesN/AraC family two-component response regulator